MPRGHCPAQDLGEGPFLPLTALVPLAFPWLMTLKISVCLCPFHSVGDGPQGLPQVRQVPLPLPCWFHTAFSCVLTWSYENPSPDFEQLQIRDNLISLTNFIGKNFIYRKREGKGRKGKWKKEKKRKRKKRKGKGLLWSWVWTFGPPHPGKEWSFGWERWL